MAAKEEVWSVYAAWEAKRRFNAWDEGGID
jgi:hypothetical protein